MIGFASLAEKTAAALEKAQRDLGRIVAEAAEHERSQPDGSDLDELVDWKRTGRDLADQRECAEEVLENAKAAAERQAVAAVEAEADRRHAAAQKLARAGEKLTLDVVALAEKLAGALAALEDNRAEVEGANQVRGSRPYIVDGERRLRAIPARETPAVTRREKRWVDAEGNTPSRLVLHNGEMIPADHRAYDLKTVEVVESPPRIEPERMPERLAEAITLVGLKGESLWSR